MLKKKKKKPVKRIVLLVYTQGIEAEMSAHEQKTWRRKKKFIKK